MGATTLDLSRASKAPAAKPNLSGMTREELRLAMIDAGICEPAKAKMRATQAWRWIHHYGVTDFAAMSNVAKDMQAKLAEHFTLARPEIVERQVSKDGTRKWLIRTAPGIEIETVYIPDVGRAGSSDRIAQVGDEVLEQTRVGQDQQLLPGPRCQLRHQPRRDRRPVEGELRLGRSP